MATTTATQVITDQDDIRRTVIDALGAQWNQANLATIAARYESRYADMEVRDLNGHGYLCDDRSTLDYCGTCQHCTARTAAGSLRRYAGTAPRAHGKAVRTRDAIASLMGRY